MRKGARMKQLYSIGRTYEYDPNDLAVAFLDVATKRYGPDAIVGVRGRFWSRRPLNLVSIKVDHHAQKIGVMGPLFIPKIPAGFVVGGEGSNVTVFNVDSRQRDEVEEFLEAIKLHLDAHSIYRGKAITSNGEFLDLSGVSLDDTVYNDKVLRDLRAHVWTVIERGEMCQAIKVGLPRRVLFDGPYGSGKSLAALLTAQIALKNGLTFFYVVPTQGGALGIVRSILASARRYQPSVVFIEDIDREQRVGNEFEFGAIMAEIDGLVSKGGKMLIIMTTNRSDRIGQGMFRPGRIDKVIRFGMFTDEDIERLLRKNIPADWLAGSLDWKAITHACKGFAPAFVCEVGKAAMLLAMSEHLEGTPLLNTQILVEAACDLKEQHEKSQIKMGFT